MTTVATEVLPSVSWPEWFNTRQNVDLAIENTPYINASVTELGNSDGPNYIRTPRGENLPGSESLLQYLRRSELLGNFCGQINLRDLENGTTENTTKYVASLDDRNSAGVLPLARRQCRPYKGPLTQHGLYQELRRKRFRVDDEGKTQQTVDDALESDIERRFLNIINMDRWGAVALIATASATQIQALGTAIENYLAFQASVRVTIPSSLPHIFALEFHIPYYGLRIHNSLVNDPRKRSDGSPLRHSWKLPFPETLSMPYHTPTGTCCLYEAQLSVAVIGLDRWTWIAYAFDDTYFDYDTLEPFTQFTAQIRPSLISPRDGDEPVWTPREHFLKTVEIKTKQVVKEWGSIVQKLQEIVRW
ncbi:uncharacterized protein K444DRAFT_661766 [Hyaloscypha bicolor E]|uniref:Uncharacterized protein n=1 Tax=Hyaloscypha bicolor E TaxID=1095630 RepID=A0A2J6TI31_9HELO|nr:uncharacterized protein K444DRAFT_661766 [Hyaloscypha bicolor E]PMD62664.1 hypothetical protein K444DRAFT_661766 [Hyaloscypha bicolor E]